jgi:hypothetical protein
MTLKLSSAAKQYDNNASTFLYYLIHEVLSSSCLNICASI